LRKAGMFNVKISGLEKLRRELADAQRAFTALDGTIATLRFNPGDPESVQDAIGRMEAAVDEKAAPYRGNALVTNVVERLKSTYRDRILELAKTADR
jgi:hypothetical protein